MLLKSVSLFLPSCLAFLLFEGGRFGDDGSAVQTRTAAEVLRTLLGVSPKRRFGAPWE